MKYRWGGNADSLFCGLVGTNIVIAVIAIPQSGRSNPIIRWDSRPVVP
ncbi:hypothetical protein JXB12_10535 [candidate division KSB1 bacterium]|nr:hypothetical protein [candidate division KSB1 bacterium]